MSSNNMNMQSRTVQHSSVKANMMQKAVGMTNNLMMGVNGSNKINREQEK